MTTNYYYYQIDSTNDENVSCITTIAEYSLRNKMIKYPYFSYVKHFTSLTQNILAKRYARTKLKTLLIMYVLSQRIQ